MRTFWAKSPHRERNLAIVCAVWQGMSHATQSRAHSISRGRVAQIVYYVERQMRLPAYLDILAMSASDAPLRDIAKANQLSVPEVCEILSLYEEAPRDRIFGY